MPSGWATAATIASKPTPTSENSAKDAGGGTTETARGGSEDRPSVVLVFALVVAMAVAMPVAVAMPMTMAVAVATVLDRALAARWWIAADDACGDERQDHHDQRDERSEDEGTHD